MPGFDEDAPGAGDGYSFEAPASDPAYRPFFVEADRMGLCIVLHPMIPAAGQESLRDFVLGPIVAFPFDTTLAVARMCYAGMFREFPNIRWVIAHAGGAIPWLMDYPYRLGAIDRAVPSIRSLAIPEGEQDRMLGGTALSIRNNVRASAP